MGVLRVYRPDGKAVYLQAGRIESFCVSELAANLTDITMASERQLQCVEPADVIARLIDMSVNPGFAYAMKLIGTDDWVCENSAVR